MNKAVLALLVIVALAGVAEASHFRYQTAYYTRSTTNPREVTFTLKQAWRRSAFGNQNVGQQFGEGSLEWGDGTSTGVFLTVTSSNTADDWMSGEQTITHTYAGTDVTFNVRYYSCCRISSLQDGNNDHDEQITTVVQLGSGAPTSSPQIDSLPLIPFTLNQLNTVQLPLLPGSDAGPIPFAISPTGLSTFGSGLSVDRPTGHGTFSFSSGGLITWTPNQDGLFAFQVYAVSPAGVRVSLDVILYVRPGTANHNPPVITAPVPTTINFTPGQTVNFDVVATDPDALDDVTIQAGSLPVGATLGACNGPAPHTTCTAPFSWPTTATSGSQLICFFARDVANNLSNQYCVQLIAGGNNPCLGGSCALKTVGSSCTAATHTGNGRCATLDFSAATADC